MRQAHTFLFLDLETTGHEPFFKRSVSLLGNDTRTYLEPWHEIIEIGALWANATTYEVLNTFEIKIKPKNPELCLPNLINYYPERAARGEWNSAVSLETAIRRFLIQCSAVGQEAYLSGQNFFFDWTFLLTALAQCDIIESSLGEYFHYKKIDVASMAVQALLEAGETYDPKNFSLRSGLMQKMLGIEPEPIPHTALNGAYQAYNVFKALRERT